jgi:hypothetical protein
MLTLLFPSLLPAFSLSPLLSSRSIQPDKSKDSFTIIQAGSKKKWTFTTEDPKTKSEWMNCILEHSRPLGGASYRFGSSLSVRDGCEAK